MNITNFYISRMHNRLCYFITYRILNSVVLVNVCLQTDIRWRAIFQGPYRFVILFLPVKTFGGNDHVAILHKPGN